MKRNRDCSLGAGCRGYKPSRKEHRARGKAAPRKIIVAFPLEICNTVPVTKVEHGPFLEKLDCFSPSQTRVRASAQQRHPAGGKHVQDELDSQFPVAVCLKMRTFVVGTAPQSLSGFRIDRSRTRLNMRGQVLI